MKTMGASLLDEFVGPTLTVTRTESSIQLPADIPTSQTRTIDPNRVIICHNHLAENTLEYGWEILVPKGADIYAYGYVFHKNQENCCGLFGVSCSEKQGTLDKLLQYATNRHSRLGVWKIEGSGDQERRKQLHLEGETEGRLLVYVRGGKQKANELPKIEINLTGEPLLTWLFADKPEKVRARITTPTGRAGETIAKVFDVAVRYW